MDKSDTKSQKYFAVSHAILEIIENDGLNDLTHSRVARQSNVSRAWIYEYMGKEKANLIEIASETFSNYFTNSSIATEINTFEDLKNHLIESQEIAFKKILDDSIIIRLYFRYRGTPTAIGTSIKKYESHWLDNMSANIMSCMNCDQKKAKTLALTLLTLRLGFYHRVATSENPAQEHALSKEALEMTYLQTFT